MFKKITFLKIYMVLNIRNIIKFIKKLEVKDISLFHVYNKFIIIDYILICTTNSENHSKFIYKEIYKNFKYNINKKLEFDINFKWILIDLNDIILNVMQKNTRNIYNLDNIYKRNYIKIDDIL
ncbi:ribosomal silencing factor RsfS [endosymbiont of Euscepes postfasciatus]|uniref:ribosome silencing factor n=1 Tax=endosymbiont of Euscepes postfasciatus TaxID=650377 RepID=UPI000DC6D757|nr:ribosome silencing factor [endosymbiont of Euscepes postfasciatus]BBA84597.1 ribosomal silencing factor RsfS [endosymbiont of Euscepes postfasciatus]